MGFPCGLVNQSLAFFVYLWVPEGNREKGNDDLLQLALRLETVNFQFAS
jgi:hypothetical protein